MQKLTLSISWLGCFLLGHSVAQQDFGSWQNSKPSLISNRTPYPGISGHAISADLQPGNKQLFVQEASYCQSSKLLNSVQQPDDAELQASAAGLPSGDESFLELFQMLGEEYLQASNNDSRHLYSKLQQLAIEQPETIAEHSDLLVSLPVNSREFHIMASLLVHLPQDRRHDMLLTVTHQIDIFASRQHQEKLMSLLQQMEPQAIPESMVDNLLLLVSAPKIADSTVRLEALSILHPSQLQVFEKDALVRQLAERLNHAPYHEIQPLFAQSLRFANIQQKQQLALNHLQANGSEALQQAALESLAQGIIPMGQELYRVVQQIASNQHHPVQKLAKEILWDR